MQNKKVILASQSPRRKQLLEWAEITFDIKVLHTDEHYPDNISIEEVPVYIATQKGKIVWDSLDSYEQNNTIVIAADTIVVLDNEIIGKPANREDAVLILSKLSGKKHRVITGVSILSEKEIISFYDVTYVQFHTLTIEQIDYYIDQYKPYDKAGAYAIQEWIGVIGIQSIEGDFYNVMGLPVSKVVKALEQLTK
ncbi:MAG: Maf family protein [Bacteroidota bacterium]